MKKSSIIIIVLLGLLLIGGCQGCGTYNKLVGLDEEVNNSWGNLQNQYQRRADLIPNLVGTVKGAADFEKETYVQVALARAGELKQKVENLSADDLTPEKLAEIQEANAQSRQAANTMINVMVERYPDLKATQNFLSLQDQLEGTENRITMARNDYNNIVKTYNTTIRRFPATLYAGFLGFERKTMFEAEAGAEKAPEVSF